MSRLAAVLLLGLVLPAAAAACPVCVGPDQASRDAFVWTTVLLSVLPLGMIGGVVGWIWRLHRARERATLPQRGTPTPDALETLPNAG